MQLEPLLPRLKALLGVILALPVQLSDTRAAYFLTYTSVVIESTTSLPLLVLPPSDSEPGDADPEVEERAGRIMEDYLGLLDLIDQAWLCLLTGEGWHTPRRFLQALYDDDGPLTLDMFRGSIGHPHSSHEAEAQAQDEARKEAQIDPTSQIRLKSILQLGREKVLAWARPYGDFGGEVFGPSGDEGRETTQEEREGWEGCVLRLFSKPIVEIDTLQHFDPTTHTEEPMRLPEFAIPPGPPEEKEEDDEDDDDVEMEEVKV